MLNKRKIIVVNPKFQFKVSLLIAGLVIISSSIFPLMIMDLFEEYMQLAIKYQPDIKAALLEKRSAFFKTMFFWELGFVVLVFTFLLFVTHRIAGPIYKLQKYLSGIREGTESGKLFFRKGDYFMDLADDINLTIESLRSQGRSNDESLDEVVAYIKNLEMIVPEDKRPVLEEIISKISN